MWQKTRFLFTNVTIMTDIVTLASKLTEMRQQARATQIDSPDLLPIVFVGTVGTGKSFLINALFGGVEINLVSPIPRMFEITKVSVWFNSLKLIETPSYDHPDHSQDQVLEEIITQLRKAKVVVHTYNITAIRRSDNELRKLVQNSGKPFITVFNRCDGLSQFRLDEHVKWFKQKTNLDALCISTKNLDELVNAIFENLPELIQHDLLYEFKGFLKPQPPQFIPQNRQEVCEEIIYQFCKKATEISITEKPGLELIPLLSLQKKMLEELAKQYPEHGPYQPATITKLLEVLSQLVVKSIPVLGPVIGLLTASVWTYLIGKFALKFYERQVTLKQITNGSSELTKILWN